MNGTRRWFLRSAGGLAFAGVGLATVPPMIVDAMIAPGVSRTINVEDGMIRGRSKDVTLQSAADPAGSREGVIHVDSDGVETEDYAFSIVNLAREGLTLEAVTELSYWYYAGPENTDHVPDEVWLILDPPDGSRKEVFRTLTGGATETWTMRDVHAELTETDPPWKELSQSAKDFQILDGSVMDVYGDAEVKGVGVGRGDPVTGPSVLDMYFDDLTVNGTTFDFPAKGGGGGNGKGKGQGGGKGDGNGNGRGKGNGDGNGNGNGRGNGNG